MSFQQSASGTSTRANNGHPQRRARLSDDASAAPTVPGPDSLELLTSALVVVRAVPQIAPLPHVVVSVSTFLDCCVHFRTLEDAAKTNDLRLLKRLIAASKRPAPSTRRYSLILCFHMFDAAKVAAKRGHYEVLKLLHQVYLQPVGNDEIFATVAGREDLDVILWLEENLDQDGDLEDTAEVAMDNHHFHVLEWIEENRPEFDVPPAAKRLSRRGLSLGPPTPLWNAATWRWSIGSMSILSSHRSRLIERLAMYANRQVEGTNRANLDAARNGHLEVVTFLHEHRSEGYTTRAMDGAATNGHFEVVKFLHERRHEGCTADAMNWAAARGFLEMVQWLHANRSEGCTTSAMDDAAGDGHLEMVQFLHANRTEGCTTNAMDNAAACGHLAVVK